MKKHIYTVRKSLLAVIFFMVSHILVEAQQGVGINTSNPDPSALLEISTTQGGLGLPVLTDAQRLAIQTPPEGLLIYNSTSKKLNAYLQGFWMQSNDVTITNVQASGIGTTGYVSIGDNTPHPSAALDLESGGNKGLVLPHSGRLVTAPAQGLLAEDTTVCQLVLHNGTSWTNLVLSSLGSTTGATDVPGLVSMASDIERIPRANAALDLVSTTQGLRLPNLTAAERDAIPSPREGLLIHCTTDDCLEYWNGTEWCCVVQTANPTLYSSCNYIFSDVCGSPTNASSQGIYSNDANNTNDFIFSNDNNAIGRRRDDWIGCPGPCSGNVPASARSLTFNPTPEFTGGDQSQNLTLTGGVGAQSYTFVAPDGTSYFNGVNNVLVIPANSVYASLSGTWKMYSSDQPDCDEVFIIQQNYLVPLQLSCGGIFSNVGEINLNAYKGNNNPFVFSNGTNADTRDCTNKWEGARGACGDQSATVSGTFSPPAEEQLADMTFSYTPGAGESVQIYSSDGGFDQTFTSGVPTVPAAQVWASRMVWHYVITSANGCVIGGGTETIRVTLRTSGYCAGIFSDVAGSTGNAPKTGIYSGTGNNGNSKNQWCDCPAATNARPN